jgi:hypothetical protein
MFEWQEIRCIINSVNIIAFVSGFYAHVDPGLDPQNTSIFIASTFVVQCTVPYLLGEDLKKI